MKLTKYDPRTSNRVSQTDWERVRRNIAEDAPIPYDPEDGPYDPNDNAAVDAYWKSHDLVYKGKVVRAGVRGPQKSPTKERITIRLSAEVVNYFRSTGSGWQSRIDETLRKSIKHRTK